MYNVLDEKTAKLIKIAISDKSLENVNKLDRDKIRADIFKCLLINLV
jgi:transcriptional regulator CtsR